MSFFTNPTSLRNVNAMSQHLRLDPTINGISSQSALAQSDCAFAMGGQQLPPHSSHPALPRLMMLVFEAVLEVVCVSLPGYIVARQGMFTAEMQKFTANLNVALFTPCLIFNKLASQLSADKLVDLAIIPAIFAVQTLVSYLCSLAVSKLFGLPKRPRNFVIAMGVFGNSNSLPISLVLSLSHTISGLHWDKKPGDNDDEVAARGILYLLIFQQLGQLVRWSWGYNVLLAPPDMVEGTTEHNTSRLEDGNSGTVEERERLLNDSPDVDREYQYGSGSEETRVENGDAGLESARSSGTGPSLRSGEQTPITHDPQVPTLSKSFSQVDDVNHLSQPSAPAASPGDRSKLGIHAALPDGRTSPVERNGIFLRMEKIPHSLKASTKNIYRRMSRFSSKAIASAFHSMPRAVQRSLKITYDAAKAFGLGVWEFMNPPLWAMLAAIVVASIPDLQHFFFDSGTFFENSVTSAIRQSGGVAVPLILVVLGGNLARNTLPNEQGSKSEDKEETKLLVAALISRMLLPLVITAPLLALTAKFVKVSILGDPIFVIVCFLITGAPSALQLAQICQINNVYMGTMSRLLFQSYVVWILPSTLVLVMCALEVVEWARR